jgi:hypothetical protein
MKYVRFNKLLTVYHRQVEKSLHWLPLIEIEFQILAVIP